MSKITRAFQKIFADGITVTGNISEFGSLAEGTPAYSKDPALIQSRTAWEQGWIGAMVGNQSPAYQDFNAYQYLVTRQIAYLLQAGIPEWDTQTTYYTGSFCQVAGVIYRSLTDANVGNAVSDIANWTPLLQPQQLAVASCRWDRTGGIISSYNVTGVTVLPTGDNRPVIALAGGVVSNSNYIVISNGLRGSSLDDPMQTYAINRTVSEFTLVGNFASGEDRIMQFDLTVFRG